jgi:hypothetical protein
MAGSRDERVLAVLVRAAGCIMLLALPAAVMPRGWMAAVHEWLGLGALPKAPIAEYLARGMSAVCALIGAILLVAARDVRRYGPVITVIMTGHIVAAAGSVPLFAGNAAIRMHVLVDALGACTVSGAVLFVQMRAARRRARPETEADVR